MESVWEAVEGAWQGIIEFSAALVIPDWGALVGLIPVGILIGVLGFFGWIVVRYRSAGPTRRGPGRVSPRTPDGIHMPGPSLAPVFVAVGAFTFFFGLLLGTSSPAFWLGLLALVITLIYWLREGMRDYDRIEAPTGVPALLYGEPPAGIHLPGPSFRPLLVSAAAAVMFTGLIVGPALVVGGVVLLFITLVGWLGDAGREYRSVLVADSTGHLASEAAPRYPVGTLAAFIVVIAVAGSLSIGGGTADDTSAAAGGSTGDASAGSTAPDAEAPAAPTGDLVLTAKDIQFDASALEIPAGAPFTIAVINNDAGVPHNVALHKGSPTGEVVFLGEIFNGADSRVYEIPALEAGAYAFICTVHPNMAGTLTAR